MHDAQYAQLRLVFLAWRHHAVTQCARKKQRIARACRVGATFYQRRFYDRWRTFVRMKLEQREETRKLQEAREWKLTSQADEDVALFDEKCTRRNKINAAVFVRKRHYFEMWKLRRKEKGKDVVHDIVQIRSVRAIQRWRRFVRLENDRAMLQQRADFFLYYWLLKSSLIQLHRRVNVKKRERTLIATIETTNRQRLLLKTMQQWQLRLQLHRMLTLWSNYVQRRRCHRLKYRSLAEAMTRKTRCCLVRHAFDVWEKQHTRNQAKLMLARVVDRQVYRKICAHVWRIWKTKTRQVAHFFTFQRACQERKVRRVWEAWSAYTQEKERQEIQRRRAVRANYLALLQKGFHGFQVWHEQQRLTLKRVETMLDAADNRVMTHAFSHWDHFTSLRKTQALKHTNALLAFESRLLKRVWTKGFRCFFTRTLAKKNRMFAAREQYYTQTMKRSVCAWKTVWQSGRKRDEALDKLLQEYEMKKTRAFKAEVLENWSEYSHAKAARRVVNAQIRDQARRRTLQKYLIQWMTYVSLRRWQQITCRQADQHYKSVMLKKCFERWRKNHIARKHDRLKTRKALVHWKLTLQRMALERWRQYLDAKKRKQRRIHEALEYRHEQFVRDGLRLWVTAALHLQEQRDRQSTCTQVGNTVNVWRRVAMIARHWRYLAIRRRVIRTKGDAVDISTNMWPQAQEDVYKQPDHRQVRHAQYTRPTRSPSEDTFRNDAGSLNWTKDRSPLSEFVLLPKNRPQPRRPLEVLLSQTETKDLPQRNDNTSEDEALRCGFVSPATPFPPLCSSRALRAEPDVRFEKVQSTASAREHPSLCPSTFAMPLENDSDASLSSSTIRQLDVLERQLMALSQRKMEWKHSQQQLEVLREEAAINHQVLPQYRAMKEQHANRTKQWLHTKERIRVLATEIQRLRGALQSQ